MIDQEDERLSSWAREVRADLRVTFAPPADALEGEGASLYLMDLRNAPPTASGVRPPYRIVLRYLVTAWAEKPVTAHRILGELIFAAMADARLEVELEALPPALWNSFGIAPRPAFVLRVPLQRPRDEEVAPLVRVPPDVAVAPATSLCGAVLGPGDRPIPAARVELPKLALATRTDARGHFRFATVPSDEAPQTLRVSVRGREVTTEVQSSSAPLIVRVPPTQEEESP